LQKLFLNNSDRSLNESVKYQDKYKVNTKYTKNILLAYLCIRNTYKLLRLAGTVSHFIQKFRKFPNKAPVSL